MVMRAATERRRGKRTWGQYLTCDSYGWKLYRQSCLYYLRGLLLPQIVEQAREADRQLVAEIHGWLYYIERCPTLGRTVYWYAVEQGANGGRPHRARCMSRKSAHERIETWARNRAQMEIVAAR